MATVHPPSVERVSVVLKTDLGGDVRRLRISGPRATLEEALHRTRTAYSSSLGGNGRAPVRLSYVDEDGDDIHIGSQPEFEEALRVAGTTKGSTCTLRLGVRGEELHQHADDAGGAANVGGTAAAGVRRPAHAPQPPVHAALAALAAAVPASAMAAEGLTRADAEDMMRVMWALGVNPRLLVKLGFVPLPAFRVWKKQYCHKGRLLSAREVAAPSTVTGEPHTSLRAVRSPSPQAPAPGRDHVARFVEHVTYADESVPVQCGSTFRKVWSVMNDSGQPWPKNVDLVGAGGDPLAVVESPLGHLAQLPSGATAQVAAVVVAPSSPGQYRGVWRLRDASSGRTFGERLWATVRCVAPPADAWAAQAQANRGTEPPPSSDVAIPSSCTQPPGSSLPPPSA